MPLSNQNTVKVSAFKGLANKLDETTIGPEFLRVAENVDIDAAGKIRRRSGYTSTGISGLVDAFSSRTGRAFLVDSNGALFYFQTVSSMIHSDIGAGPYVWVEIGDQVGVIGSENSFIVDAGMAVSQWGIEMPAEPVPVVVGGDLPAGRYVVAASLVDELTGRESGVTAGTVVDISAGEGIQVTFDSRSGYLNRLYLSAPDGPDVYAAGTYAVSSVNVDVNPNRLGAIAKRRLTSPPPVCDAAAFWRGAVWCATYDSLAGATRIIPSRPMDWNHFELDTPEAIYLPGKVVMMAAVDAMLICGTTQKIWGYTPDGGMPVLADYPAVPNRPVYNPGGSCWFWTSRGLATAPPFTNLNDSVLSPEVGQSASLLWKESGGTEQVIVAIEGDGAPRNAANIGIQPVTVTG